MIRTVLLLAAVAGAVLFLVWWFSPDQVVERRSRSLFRVLTIDAGTGIPARLAGMGSLDAMLADEVFIDHVALPEVEGTIGCAQIKDVLGWLCRHARRTRFDVAGIDSIEVDGAIARVDLVLEVLVELPDRRLMKGMHPVTLGWRLAGKSWVLERVEGRGLPVDRIAND
ncbi:MAG: hypothetical protein FJ385_09380 [Verrucomicrobia bacterium]|nr:hypothetical protein [Verrucomicrobiota bacterium]